MTGAELKSKRLALGLTLSELSERLDVPLSTLARWEASAALPNLAPRVIEMGLRGLRPRKRVERRGRPRKQPARA